MTDPPLTRGAGVSLWRQIAEALAEEIADGRLQPGERVPTEAALAERFSVNRHTVRRAMAVLEEEGAIRIEQGRGSFVREPVIDYLVGRRTRFSENLLRQKRVPVTRLLFSAETLASAPIAEALDLAVGDPILHLETLGLADERPVSVTSHFFARRQVPGLAEAFGETGSVSAALRACGITDYRRRLTRVTARLPTGSDAAHLQQDRHRPILVSESINIDSDGLPVEYGLCRFNGDWVQIVFEPDATPAPNEKM